MSEVLVLGAAGMLGRAFRTLLDAKGIPFQAMDRAQADLTDPRSIARAIDGRAEVVINCAAWTDVDGAEAREDEATEVNGRTVGRIAERCLEVGAMLVHFGTDYVFDGEGKRPYRIDDPLAPLNAYGRSKADGELRLRSSGAKHLHLRTSWVYAPWGKNFVRTMANLSRERDVLRVVDDQRGRPTSAEHLARTTLALLEKGATGTLHVTDGGECTWFELARFIASHVRPSCRVEPCTTAEFPRPAKRPRYSVLDLEPVEALLGPMPDYRTHVLDVLNRLE